MSLDNKVAIVTGAGHGVGAAIAKALANANARVAINDLNPDRAAKVAQAINDEGGTAVAIAADVSNKFQCVHLIESTRDAFGQIDLLVNNAAITPKASILKMDEWDWNRCFEVNLKGTFFMTQLCGRVMADENGERGGVIINLASTAGFEEGVANYGAYGAASAGIVGFSRTAAVELDEHHLRVYALLVDEDEMKNGRFSQVSTVTQTILSLYKSTHPPSGRILSTKT